MEVHGHYEYLVHLQMKGSTLFTLPRSLTVGFVRRDSSDVHLPAKSLNLV